MKQIFDWLREQTETLKEKADVQRKKAMEEKATNFEFYEVGRIYAFDDMLELINEAEAKWGYHAICYLDSPCEYQNEDISVVDVGISCELLDKLVEPSKRCSHGLCEFRTHEECVSFEYCENCFVDAVKDVIKNSDSRFRKIMEVE